LSNSHWGWLIRPTFWITCLWSNKAYITLSFFEVTSSEKKNSQNNLPALAYLKKVLHFMFFLAICLKKGRSNVIYPVRVRVKAKAIFCLDFLLKFAA
jgi:hypothetical protein